MKNKRLLALLMTIFMIATMIASAIPASAASSYTEDTSNSNKKVTFPHKLEVNAEGVPVPNVKYTFTVKSNIARYSDGTITYGIDADVTSNADKNPVGTTLFEATYSPADGTGDTTAQKDVTLDFSNLTFTQPGIYYYEIQKVASGAGSTGSPAVTNELETFYVIIRADGVGDKLKVTSSMLAQLTSTTKLQEIVDNYPAVSNSLTIEKKIEGLQASLDQYFKFTVSLTGLASIANSELSVTTTAGPGIASTPLYGENNGSTYTNPTKIQVGNDGTATATFWLKANEHVTINNLLTGAKFTVTEEDYSTNGYSTSWEFSYRQTADSDTQKVSGSTLTTGEQTVRIGNKVVFTNSKALATPTGVILAAAPAVTVIALGSVGLGILGVSKKRKEEEAE